MKAEYRPAERQAYCRVCDGIIHKGEMMISFYSFRNQGMYVHLHSNCTKELTNLIKEGSE